MKKFIEEFKAFALRGNMMDMAVGVIIGGGFTGIVDVTDGQFYQSDPEFCDRGSDIYITEYSGICVKVHIRSCEFSDPGFCFILPVERDQ